MRPVFCRSMKQLQVSDSDDSSAATCMLNLEDPSWLIADSYKFWKPQILHQAFAGKKSQHLHENMQKQGELLNHLRNFTLFLPTLPIHVGPGASMASPRSFPGLRDDIPRERPSCFAPPPPPSGPVLVDESGTSSAMQQSM